MIRDYGDINNPLWVVTKEPYAKDAENGYIYSGGYGYSFKKTWKLSGAPDPFITCVNPELSVDTDWNVHFPLFLQRLNNAKPKIIVSLGDDLITRLVPATAPRQKKTSGKQASALWKWAGSLLQSPLLNFEHYIIGTYTPDFVTNNWDLHEIQGYIDFGRAKSELDYYNLHNSLQPMPVRSIITEPTYETVCDYLRWLLDAHANHNLPCENFVSSDIETIRPKKASPYYDLGHSGYTYTISLAPSPKEAISFCLWDYPPSQAIIIWRLLARVLNEIPQIGQNYFTFDSHHLEALGYKICLVCCSDTMLRHHILWPGLPHKLQFQTRQYTREPYYKDEGKNWTVKHKHQLMRYNCLDTMVTYEIWIAQEEEFNDRPHLR